MPIIGLIIFGALLVGAIIYIKTRKKPNLNGVVTESVLLTEEEATAGRTIFPGTSFSTSIPVPVATRDYIRQRMAQA